MAKKPKQLDLVDELERKDKRNAQARARRAAKKKAANGSKLPIQRKNTLPEAKQGRGLVKKTLEGEYIPKDKPVGEAKTTKGNTYEGQRGNARIGEQKKLEGPKGRGVEGSKTPKALPKPSASKGSKFLNALKIGGKVAGRALPWVGAALAAKDVYDYFSEDDNRKSDAGKKDVKGGRSKAAKAKEQPKATSTAKEQPKKDEPKKTASSSSSFKEAFAAARKSYKDGKGGATFEWNGKKYSVATKDDIKKSGKKDLREYLNAGLKPERNKK